MKQRMKKHKKITCPYCGAPAVLRDASFVYGDHALVDKLYVCAHYPACDSYVGVFKNSEVPKGTLANSELRNKRILAHRAFDAIWKQGIMTRGQTYQWMQHKFSLTKQQAHIGNFSDYMCQELMSACREVLENNQAKGAWRMDYTLSDEQRKLVENNLSVIDQVIRKRITMNREIPGMEYDDLYQIGAIGLCKAAVKYKKKENATFETYAFRVIKNELLDYVRSVFRKEAARSRFISDEEVFLRQVQGRNNEFSLNERTSIDILLEKRKDVSETTRKGIDAMVLQMQGYSGTDIAEKYDVKPNYVAACISRARKQLMNDRKFVNAVR